ncbi:DNA-directed RNA polymerase specialized sigma subunit [Paenibacillus sp. 4624]
MPGLFTAIALFIKELTLLVSYVKNNAFPQPLAEDDEAKHLRLMAEGNAHSRNLLIEHNLRLVAHIVKKFDNTGEDQEDLISIGTIGLIKAIESFQQGKGTKLATFAARCIENEILMHLRSLKKTRKDVSLHDPIGTDKEGNELTFNGYPYTGSFYLHIQLNTEIVFKLMLLFGIHDFVNNTFEQCVLFRRIVRLLV